MSDCAIGLTCLDGVCVEARCEEGECPCRSDEECDSGETCWLVVGECVARQCEDDGGCGLGQRCAGGLCVVDVEADADLDGVPDLVDSCPSVVNAQDLDTDGDGRGDACDEDADGDGYRGDADGCPLVFEREQRDADGDGLGNACDPDWNGVTVSGRLVFSGPGAHVEDARLRLVGPAEVGEVVTPMADGRFVFVDAVEAAGAWVLTVQWPGWVAAPVPFGVQLDQETIGLGEVPVSRDAEGEQARVLGGIVTLDGRTTHDGTVIHQRLLPGLDLVGSTVTAEDGAFALPASAFESYQLDIVHEGFERASLAPVVYTGEGFEVDGAPLRVELAAAAHRGEVVVNVGFEPAFIPAAQRMVRVTLREEGGPGVYSGTAEEGAPLVFSAVAAGAWLIDATRAGFRSEVQRVVVTEEAPRVEVVVGLTLERLQGSSLDLRGVDVDVADLESVELVGANLAGATLRGAGLSCRDLRGADLSGAELSDLDLRGARLDGASLREARLEGVDLRGAWLRGVEGEGAELVGARLAGEADVGCEVAGPSPMSGASFPRTRWDEADLSGYDLRGANLSGASFIKTLLAGVDAEGVDLRGAWFEDVLLGCHAVERLAATCRDRFEPNAVAGQGALLEAGVVGGLGLCAGAGDSTDYYQVELEAGQTLEVVAVPWTLEQELVLSIQTSEGQTLAVQSTRIGPLAASSSGRLSIRVGQPDIGIDVAPTGYDLIVFVDGQAPVCAGAPTATLAGARLDGANLFGVGLDGVDARGSSWVGATVGPSWGRGPVPPDDCVLPDGCLWSDVDTCANVPAACERRPTSWIGASLEGANLAQATLEQVRGHRVDLTGANLTGSVSFGGQLPSAVLEGARLGGASWRGNVLVAVDMGGIDMGGVDLAGSWFWGARLSDCALPTRCADRCDGQGTCCSFDPASLPRADVCLTSCRAASLRGASLTDAVLNGVWAVGVDATGASFVGAELTDSRWSWATLTRADLRWAVMERVEAQGVDLREAQLDDARLRGGNLRDAWLGQASLRHATLQGVYGQRIFACDADFETATMTAIDLTGAALTGSRFERARMGSARLVGVTAITASFRDALMGGAVMTDLIATNARFDRVVLDGADLSRALLTDATLWQAVLREATLTQTGLTRANLIEADLSGANLTGARTLGASFTDARLSGATICPSGQSASVEPGCGLPLE